jgi:nucleoside-diphosphate-sugar epimerase
MSGERLIAVTGAGGFIGGAVCRRLAAEGAGVVGVDLREEARPLVEAQGAKFVAADIRSTKSLEDAFAGCDAVVNTAALVGDWGRMEEFIEANVRGTLSVLDAAEASGVGRVVHLASVAGWGYEFSRDLDEGAPLRSCGGPYADTKGASDYLARGRGAVVIRPGDVYGPGSVPWTIRPVEAIRSGTFALPGSGEGIMTLIYVDDLVDAIVAATSAPGVEGLAMAVWDGEPVTASEFFNRYSSMLGKGPVRTAPLPLVQLAAAGSELVARVTGRPPTVSREAIRYISRQAAYPNRRARDLLGWEPRVGLDEGMNRTEDWLAEQGLLD